MYSIAHPPPAVLSEGNTTRPRPPIGVWPEGPEQPADVGESMYPRFENRGIIAPPHPLFSLSPSGAPYRTRSKYRNPRGASSTF